MQLNNTTVAKLKENGKVRGFACAKPNWISCASHCRRKYTSHIAQHIKGSWEMKSTMKAKDEKQVTMSKNSTTLTGKVKVTLGTVLTKKKNQTIQA